MQTRLVLFLISALVITQSYSVVIQVENLPEKCDWSKCAAIDPNAINVHLVPHTHDDVGWLKTVDQYYYGSQSQIQKAGVQYILDTVVQELIRNKDRRFIYVETAFFWKWWKEQDEPTRAIVKELVRNGQLEFVNGGWVMPDEATTHYSALIDQSSWGLRRLNDTFGKCGVPRVSWQIDPFGHSRELASLYAQMNYDAVFFAREDYQDQIFRQSNKTLEHVWQGSDDLGSVADLFTGMLDMGYGPPKGLNWDLVGGMDEPVIDNPESEEYNVPTIINSFVNYAKFYSLDYATKHILFPVGTDFHYQDAHIYFKNMDKLIKHVNEAQKGVRVFYSTPSCYTKALHESKHRFAGKNDDYFPYASKAHTYWTGYFTSRPALKRMERVGNHWLQACKQLDVLALNQAQFESNITILREAMGVMQHHDAIAGTEKQNVSKDYAKNLQQGIEQCRTVIGASLTKLTGGALGPVHFCDYLNISSCVFTETDQSYVVTLYNPLGHELSNRTIRLPARHDLYYSVRSTSQHISASLVEIPEYVRNIPGRMSRATHELVFRVSIPALGLSTYQVTVSKTKLPNSATLVTKTKVVSEIRLRSKNFDLIFDKKGQVAKIKVFNGETVSFTNSFRYYKGFSGENLYDQQSSGAYIFRPVGNSTYQIGKLLRSDLYVDTASGVQEVHQQFDSFVQQVIRVDPEGDAIEFEFVVGPIPVADNIGKEIITLYQTNMQNERTFYTDANGRQLMKRVLNYRPSWQLEVTEPVAGNYYPVTSHIAIRDQKKALQLTVLTDRAQGGASIHQGAIELMVHRRLLHDDAYGVAEALNEPGIDGRGLVIRGRHLVQVATITKAASRHRVQAQQLFLEPVLAFSEVTSKSVTPSSQLATTLPPQVHLLTLEQWRDNQYLLRLEHFYQRDEHHELSKPATVSLRNLFKPFQVVRAREVTLGANQDIAAIKNRLQFEYDPVGFVHQPLASLSLDPGKLEVILNPMQIRTFVLDVKPN